MRLLITRRMPARVMDAARARFDVVARDEESQVLSPDELRAALRDFDVVMPTLGDRFSAEVFADVPKPRCRLLANFGVGFNHIDTDAARAAGVEFRHDTATGLVMDGDRVTGVRLASGDVLTAGAVVSCAGTRSAQVLGWAGVCLPVEPRKRTVFVIDAPNARHPDAPLIIDHQGYYMRPEQGGWITATVPADDGPCDPEDFTPDAHLFEDVIWPMLYARSEGFDAVKVQRLWVGHYDYNTLDQNAIVGQWPGRPGLYLAAGFSGHGLQQAPAVGRGLAELIVQGGWRSLDLSDLGPDRVLEGRPFLERAVV